MIKMLFYIENLTEGGAEKVLRNLVNNMDQSKFDITVQTVFPVNAEKYLVPGIHYRALYHEENVVTKLRYRIETALGIAYRLHMKGNYDIEVAYLECGATKVMAASTNQRAVKLAWVHCELKSAVPNPEAFAAKTKKWYQKFDKVVCVSQKVKEDYMYLYGNVPESVVVYNAVDVGEIMQKAAETMPGDLKTKNRVIAAVGRLTAQKNMMRLLQTYKRLVNEGFDYDLWIIGEGDERPMLEKYIDENGLNDSVSLLGFQENPYPFMREADLLVCSSIYEGFSTYITECLILGKPTVTTDCSGMRELLGESEFGLITPNSDEGFYEGVKRMLSEPGLLEHYRMQAQKRGLEFRAGVQVSETESFLRRMIERRDHSEV